MKQAIPIRAEQKGEATPDADPVAQMQEPAAPPQSVPSATVPAPALKVKPFNFARQLRKCREAAEIVGSAEWEDAGNRRDEEADEEREELYSEVYDPTNAAITKIQAHCLRPTTSIDDKAKGIETLLDIIDLLDQTDDTTEYFLWNENNGKELEDEAVSAIQAVVGTFPAQDQATLFDSPPFEDLKERLGEHYELSSLVDAI